MQQRKPVITAEEFGKTIGKSTQSVLGLIRKHQIAANKVGKSYLIPITELDKFTGVVATDEVTTLRMENERLKNQLEGMKRQYATIKQLSAALTGACEIL